MTSMPRKRPRKLAPGNRRKRPDNRRKPGPKKRPRGRPFPPGNRKGRKFAKGVSGNPEGRPPISPEYSAAMAQLEPLSYQALGDILADPAHRDRASTARYVTDRLHGKPIQRTEVSGPDGGPMELEADGLVAALEQLVSDPKDPGGGAE